jgi:branched-chain amino acid transport system substrate-binding protein
MDMVRSLRRGRYAAVALAAALVITACGETPDDPTADDGQEPVDEEGDEGDEGEDGEGEDGESMGDDGPEGEPIRIGISMPLTGDFSEPGKGIQQGYELWAAQVNESGGLLDRPVELLFRDDRSDPNTAVSDYEQLITSEEVDFVFGPFSSRLVIPSSEVVEQYEMLFLQPAGASAEVFERGLEFMFYTAPAIAPDHYNYLADFLLGLPEGERPQTVAVAALDDPFAQGTAYGLRDQLEAGGMEIVVDEVYPPETTDFASIAARIADADADVFIGGTQFEDSVGLVRSFQELGYQPDVAAFSTGPTLNEFPEAVGGATDGILSPVGWAVNAEFPSNVEMVAAYEEMFGGVPNEDVANGYTVGQVLAQAVEAVGCAEQGPCQAEIRDHIRANEFDTVVGPLTWDEAGRPQGAHFIQQWIDGQIEIVLDGGTGTATAEPLYPKPEW